MLVSNLSDHFHLIFYKYFHTLLNTTMALLRNHFGALFLHCLVLVMANPTIIENSLASNISGLHDRFAGEFCGYDGKFEAALIEVLSNEKNDGH
jgi:hypothetical protein